MAIKLKRRSINTTPRIEKVVSFLFSRIDESSHLYIMGSRARGDCTSKSDWDFTIDAGKPLPWNFFAVLRQDADEIAFPDEIDIMDLNRAPVWFRESIHYDLIEVLR